MSVLTSLRATLVGILLRQVLRTGCADIEGPITFLGGFPLLLEYDQTFCIEGKPLIMCKSCYTRYKKRWVDGALFLITEV